MWVVVIFTVVFDKFTQILGVGLSKERILKFMRLVLDCWLNNL